MAAQRLIRTGKGLAADPGKPVAYLFDLPLTFTEAYAYSNIEAGIATERDHELMRTWLVKMILVHGTWVQQQCPFIQI